MVEELLEAEAIEDDVAMPSPEPATDALPIEREAGDLSLWTDEARTVALAAAGGIVAGAATVAVAKAASRAVSPSRRGVRRGLLRREKQREVVASRSFLIDVHLLGR